MWIYLLTQTAVQGCDTFDSCVVVAPDEAAAKATHPRNVPVDPKVNYYNWPVDTRQVTARLVGKARDSEPAGVICASFNAG